MDLNVVSQCKKTQINVSFLWKNLQSEHIFSHVPFDACPGMEMLATGFILGGAL